jgi:hypothetical protein
MELSSFHRVMNDFSGIAKVGNNWHEFAKRVSVACL